MDFQNQTPCVDSQAEGMAPELKVGNVSVIFCFN